MKGPETIVFNADGTMLAPTWDGWIMKISLDGTHEKWAYTGGRPLGGKFDSNGDLIISVSGVGLCQINYMTRQVTILVSSIDGQLMELVDDLDIASDGKVYFSDATTISTPTDYKHFQDLLYTSVLNYLEGTKTGRLLVYDPATGKTTVLLENLFFANGVTLSQDEDFVLVAETFELLITRYWIKGPKAGTSDVFIENLPGYPDGISRGSDGGFFIAIPSPVIPTALHLRSYPILRSLMLKLPRFVQPAPLDYGHVVKVSADGKSISSLHDPSGDVISHIASITEHKGHLYFGSFSNDHIGQLKL
uniref:Gluconolactonase n=1 Tax=Hirondellea gigas TaxID=1518452 RepID=A0A6A7G9R0_9CRUS